MTDTAGRLLDDDDDAAVAVALGLRARRPIRAWRARVLLEAPVAIP